MHYLSGGTFFQAELGEVLDQDTLIPMACCHPLLGIQVFKGLGGGQLLMLLSLVELLWSCRWTAADWLIPLQRKWKRERCSGLLRGKEPKSCWMLITTFSSTLASASSLLSCSFTSLISSSSSMTKGPSSALLQIDMVRRVFFFSFRLLLVVACSSFLTTSNSSIVCDISIWRVEICDFVAVSSCCMELASLICKFRLVVLLVLFDLSGSVDSLPHCHSLPLLLPLLWPIHCCPSFPDNKSG